MVSWNGSKGKLVIITSILVLGAVGNLTSAVPGSDFGCKEALEGLVQSEEWEEIMEELEEILENCDDLTVEVRDTPFTGEGYAFWHTELSIPDAGIDPVEVSMFRQIPGGIIYLDGDRITVDSLIHEQNIGLDCTRSGLGWTGPGLTIQWETTPCDELLKLEFDYSAWVMIVYGPIVFEIQHGWFETDGILTGAYGDAWHLHGI